MSPKVECLSLNFLSASSYSLRMFMNHGLNVYLNRSVACTRKKAASVLLKMFISGIEGCHTTDAPKRMC